MIFATVGTQLPFDRMINVLDNWSLKQKVNKCFAQIGEQGAHPKSIDFSPNLTPLQFAKHIANCKVILSHAGMGTILTALQHKKPIIVMPRLAKYGEHRNDHQLATVANLEHRAGIHVARGEDELLTLLERVAVLRSGSDVSSAAGPDLLSAISTFILSDKAKGLRYA